MEITSALVQTVAPNDDVLFTSTPVRGNCMMMHREGSGLVNLKGPAQSCPQCRALYQIEYNGNIALPADGTPGPISLSLAIEGEPLATSRATVTPTAAGAFFNVAVNGQVSVPRTCCSPVSIRNTSGVPIEVENSNLVVTRLA